MIKSVVTCMFTIVYAFCLPFALTSKRSSSFLVFTAALPHPTMSTVDPWGDFDVFFCTFAHCCHPDYNLTDSQSKRKA